MHRVCVYDAVSVKRGCHTLWHIRRYITCFPTRERCVFARPVYVYMCVCIYVCAAYSVYMCYDATIPAYLVTLPRQCHTLRIVSTG